MTAPLPRLLRASLAVLALSMSTASALRAQCTNYWLPSTGPVGTNGGVLGLVRWDPDGPGPAPEVVVAGGAFSYAGDVACAGVAQLDPVTRTWTPLGAAFRSVSALLVDASGALVAGGELASGGHAVATWSGSAWLPFGWFDAPVHALLETAGGDLVAGGEFRAVGGQLMPGVARFDGAQWSALGGGVTMLGFGIYASVQALAELPNGDVVAAGRFDFAGQVAVDDVARWDGAAWSGYAPLPNQWLSSLAVLPNGDLVVGGRLTSPNLGGLMRWTGAAWSTFWPLFAPVGTRREVTAIATAANGDLLVGGYVQPAGSPLPGDGFAARVTTAGTGAQLGSGFDPDVTGGYGPIALLELSGEVFAGGYMPRAAGADVGGFAVYAGADWEPVGDGLGRQLEAVLELQNGDVVVGGYVSGGVRRRQGASWPAVGGGVTASGYLASVLALAELPGGGLVVAGDFDSAGGVPAGSIAIWDGAAWDPMNGGVDGFVQALAVLPNGDLVVGGSFTTAGGAPAQRIARWDGVAWSAFAGAPTASIAALSVAPDGELFALTPPGSLHRYDGALWTTLPAVLSPSEIATAMAATTDGVYLATFQGLLYRWSPPTGQWGQLYTGPCQDAIYAIAQIPGSTFALMLGGAQTAALFCPALSRLGGASPPALGGMPANSQPLVRALRFGPSGDLHVVGYFYEAGGQPAAHYARLTTSCPPSAVAAGSGCVGSGGLNALQATSLPWLATTFTSRATGMPANGLAVAVHGLQTAALPLGSILPQGQPGCALLVSPDLLDLRVPAGGAAELSLAIPGAIPLLGATLHQQVVALELGAGGITALTSGNRLTVTIGAF